MRLLPMHQITEPLDEPDQGKKAASHKGTKNTKKNKDLRLKA